MWVQAIGTVALGVASYRRGSTVSDVMAGRGSFDDLDAADAVFTAVAGIVGAAVIAVLIVRCLWSYRTVKNALTRDPRCTASAGMACGGWFIPIGSIWLPWQHLRRAGTHFGQRTSALNWWQALSIVGGLGTGGFRITVNGDSVGWLHAQGVVLFVAGIFALGAAFVAMKAMRDIDSATSGSEQAAVR